MTATKHRHVPRLLAVALLSLGGCARKNAPAPLLVAAGGDHTCLLQSTGEVWCWGDGAQGQLGDGKFHTSPTPVKVTGLGGDVRQISGGDNHTCALLADGGVRCWGEGASGQLGDGQTQSSPVPVVVAGLEDATHLSAGWRHTCAVTKAGAAVCWGENAQGQLGNGGGDPSLAPGQVSGLEKGVKSMVAGGAHTCALKTDGSVLCWGYNDFGQLGDGTKAHSRTPVKVTGLSGVRSLSAGWGHNCAVKKEGAALCWGYGGSGRLGIGHTADSEAPVPVMLLESGVKSVASGWGHNCALMDDGGALCWGGGGGGRLGNGDVQSKKVPVLVSVPKGGFKTLGAGYKHTCGAQGDHKVFCWGLGTAGRLGRKDMDQSAVPVPVLGL